MDARLLSVVENDYSMAVCGMGSKISGPKLRNHKIVASKSHYG